MLYLIKSYLQGNHSILKIGYTDNIEKRMYQYFSANPGVEPISFREGDELLEDMIQLYLTYLGYQYRPEGRSNEWFYNVPEVRNIFHISIQELGRKLWKVRDKVLDLNRDNNLRIYEYLREKNLNDFYPTQFKISEEGKLIRVKYNRLDEWYLENKFYQSENLELTDEFSKLFYGIKSFYERMQLVCKWLDSGKNLPETINPKFLNYYNFLGTAGCRAISYQEDLILNKIKDYMNQDTLYSEIIKAFNIGERLSKKIIKSRIADVYKIVNIKATAKAIDINKWFEVRDTMLTNDIGKREAGFEILALKKNN